MEIVSIVETSTFTQETEAVDMDDEVQIVGTSQLNNGGNIDDDDFGNSSDESNTEEVKDKEQKKIND